MDGAREDEVKLVVAECDAAEALGPTEAAFDLVAASVAFGVVGWGPTSVQLGRDNGLIAELGGQAPGGVILVGAVHDQGGAAGERAEPAQQLASTGRIVALTRREADD